MHRFASSAPTPAPTPAPTDPTRYPTAFPTPDPTKLPSVAPTDRPTAVPTLGPTSNLTPAPSPAPTLPTCTPDTNRACKGIPAKYQCSNELIKKSCPLTCGLCANSGTDSSTATAADSPTSAPVDASPTPGPTTRASSTTSRASYVLDLTPGASFDRAVAAVRGLRPGLRHVAGDLIITGTGISATAMNTLFVALESVGGSIRISGDNGDTPYPTFAAGDGGVVFASLRTVKGDGSRSSLDLNQNGHNGMTGLSCPALIEVEGTILLNDNADLAVVTLPQLVKVGGGLVIRANPALGNEGLTLNPAFGVLAGYFSAHRMQGGFTCAKDAGLQAVVAQCLASGRCADDNTDSCKSRTNFEVDLTPGAAFDAAVAAVGEMRSISGTLVVTGKGIQASKMNELFKHLKHIGGGLQSPPKDDERSPTFAAGDGDVVFASLVHSAYFDLDHMGANGMTGLSFPELAEMRLGHFGCHNNDDLATLDLPKLEKVNSFLLYLNPKLETVSLPRLRSVQGSRFVIRGSPLLAQAGLTINSDFESLGNTTPFEMYGLAEGFSCAADPALQTMVAQCLASGRCDGRNIASCKSLTPTRTAIPTGMPSPVPTTTPTPAPTLRATPVPTPEDSQSDASGGGGTSSAAIAGIVVAAVLVAALAFAALRRKARCTMRGAGAPRDEHQLSTHTNPMFAEYETVALPADGQQRSLHALDPGVAAILSDPEYAGQPESPAGGENAAVELIHTYATPIARQQPRTAALDSDGYVENEELRGRSGATEPVPTLPPPPNTDAVSGVDDYDSTTLGPPLPDPSLEPARLQSDYHPVVAALVQGNYDSTPLGPPLPNPSLSPGRLQSDYPPAAAVARAGASNALIGTGGSADYQAVGSGALLYERNGAEPRHRAADEASVRRSSGFRRAPSVFEGFGGGDDVTV